MLYSFITKDKQVSFLLFQLPESLCGGQIGRKNNKNTSFWDMIIKNTALVTLFKVLCNLIYFIYSLL